MASGKVRNRKFFIRSNPSYGGGSGDTVDVVTVIEIDTLIDKSIGTLRVTRKMYIAL